jgi:hypothetical protein
MMARDYEDVHGIDSLPDEDVRELILQRIGEGADIDADLVEVRVDAGHIFLEGRVGTEHELQVIEQLVTNVAGGDMVTNELVVDGLVRGERSEAADIAAAEDASAEPTLGEGGHRTSDTAEHLLDDTERDLFGTRSTQDAIEQGHSYNPPDGPIQEGTWSEEDR